jgi:hypothetical protein
MISQPQLEELSVSQEPRTKAWRAIWPRSWATLMTEIWQALLGWRKTYYATLTHDFGSISAQSQATQTLTVSGARSGDMVSVRPTTAVNGIITDGTVTADNTVTLRAVNYSSAPIDPGEQVYMVLVFQQ